MNSKRMTTGTYTACLVALICGLPWASAVGTAMGARQIMEEVQRRADVKSQRYEGRLEAFDSAGKSTEKRWVMERVGSHGQSKEIIRFTAPAEVKGVALLVVNHPDRASDQWMWTPALERDRRIALQDRSTRFFGTDFSFEDLEERDVNQYEYSQLDDQTVDGVVCWTIHSFPKQAKSSQYTKSVMLVRSDNYVITRIESYIEDKAVRRLNYSDIRQVQGVWTAHQLVMTDLRRQSHTRLTLNQVAYNVALKDDDFTLQALRRQ